MSGKKKPYHGHRKRLREKFLKAGLRGFHDYEVVELLLTYAIPRRDVKPEAKALVRRFGGLSGVLDAVPDEVSEVKGVGQSAASFLSLARECTAAYLRDRKKGGKSINTPADAIDYLGIDLAARHAEGLTVLYLNAKNQVMDSETLGEGDGGHAKVRPRVVIERAIEKNARSLIFVRTASRLRASERAAAGKLHDAATAIDILVHDYLVVTPGRLVSGRMEKWFGG